MEARDWILIILLGYCTFLTYAMAKLHLKMLKYKLTLQELHMNIQGLANAGKITVQCLTNLATSTDCHRRVLQEIVERFEANGDTGSAVSKLH